MAAGLAELRPAIGLLPFTALFAAYFAMAYLLLGSVFLSVGAQASSMREIQMLSLPITVIQVGMFALSSAAASHPGSRLALFAEVFPLSSPFGDGRPRRRATRAVAALRRARVAGALGRDLHRRRRAPLPPRRPPVGQRRRSVAQAVWPQGY